MPKSNEKRSIGNIIAWSIIALLGVVLLLITVFPLQFSADGIRKKWLETATRQLICVLIVVELLFFMRIRLFGRVRQIAFAIPCLLVAINNFPFISYFNGNMRFVRTETEDILCFTLYCISVGLFEEFVFRGVVFSALASLFPKDRTGLMKTFVISSVLFGVVHLSNLFGGAGLIPTLLQVVYTTLMGGVFAFVLIKTQNLFCCAFVHALYNFGGLLLDTPARMGLGTGVVFDTGTIILTVILGICVATFIFYHLHKYPEAERSILYKRLGLNEK